MIRSVALTAAVCFSLAGCSVGSQSSTPCPNASTAMTARACGGMSALVAKARSEGTLNVIALPRDWVNYGALLDAFQARYGIKVVSSNPAADSAAELAAAKQMGRSSAAPDVFDLRSEVAAASTSMFAPYEVARWDQVYFNQKDQNGLWTQDYGGYMAIGYDSNKVHSINSLQDLLDPAFPARVSIKGDPARFDAGLYAVMMANLAQYGLLSDITNGVDFFHRLRLAGKLSRTPATFGTVKSGATPVVFDWDFMLNQYAQANPSWHEFIPAYPTLGYYFAQAINKDAPHPAAARLWEEYLYSDDGQRLWMAGGASPVLARLIRQPSTDPNAPNLNAPPMLMSADEIADAKTYLAAHWTAAIS